MEKGKKLEYIKNDTARKVSYKKRVKAIVKKTEELSLLYGVDACTVIHGPYDEAPVVWPPVEAEARRILTDFERYEAKRAAKAKEKLLKKKVAEAEEELLKLQQKNRRMQMENLMAELLNGKPLEEVAVKDLHDLLLVVDDRVTSARNRLSELERNNNNNNNNPNHLIDVGTNVVDSLPDQHPGNEMVMKGPWDMQAGPSNQPMDGGNGSNIA